MAPAPERTLKGILGNGDRSAVMFELNGVTKNYEKGEKIGNSGWVLVRVENGNAVIRRNGEVRTLSVGQRI
jgi:type II secretory pathway component PulC